MGEPLELGPHVPYGTVMATCGFRWSVGGRVCHMAELGVACKTATEWLLDFQGCLLAAWGLPQS